MVDTFAISVRLAKALLLSNGQITIEEIEDIPFVNGRSEAYAIAQRLLGAFAPPYQIAVDSGIGESDVRLRLASIEEASGHLVK